MSIWFGLGNGDIYQIGAAASIATMAGFFGSIGILAVYFMKKHPAKSDIYLVLWTVSVQTLNMFGIVASLNNMHLLVVQLADVFTLLPGLLQYGFTRGEAMQAKGVFDRGQPLIQLGAVLGSSFALALIPNLSKNKWLTQPRIMYQQIESGMILS